MLSALSGVAIPLHADLMNDYRQACETPYYKRLDTAYHLDRQAQFARAAAEGTCSALIARLSSIESPSAQERLALLKARLWFGDLSKKERCEERRAIADQLPDHPEMLHQLALCVNEPPPGTEAQERLGNEKRFALLQRALEIDPLHYDSLQALTMFAEYAGENYGVSEATLAKHRRVFCEIARPFDKLPAAARIFSAAASAGDREAAAAIRARTRRDLGLDALDYGPERRTASLERACGGRLFHLDLEDVCLSAVEQLAGDAATAGAPIFEDVLRHMERAFELFRYAFWKTGPKTAAAARLKAVLDAHPESLWSSEHYRVHAKTAGIWAERNEGLRRAVDADRGNVGAMCDLADGLARIGARVEAGTIYQDLSVLPRVWPCDPEKEMRKLEGEALRGTEPYAAPEDPVEFMIVH